MELLLSLLSSKVLAQAPIVGTIDNPLLQQSYGDVTGLGLLISNALRLFFVVAGIITLFNFILAGFQYMSSAGDPKTLQSAWNRIMYSLIGLVIMSGAFVLAAIFGYLIFKDPLFMLRPAIYGPR
jgi:hypothetical protein